MPQIPGLYHYWPAHSTAEPKAANQQSAKNSGSVGRLSNILYSAALMVAHQQKESHRCKNNQHS